MHNTFNCMKEKKEREGKGPVPIDISVGKDRQVWGGCGLGFDCHDYLRPPVLTN